MLGDETIMELPGVGGGADFERFRAKARQFLKAHEDHIAIHRLRFNEPLKAADVKESTCANCACRCRPFGPP